ncbi:MAG: DNA-binding response regulator [Gammaproteobacteria bacterium]|nr:MAG: DNA-binding response regulator [Gammaproteobacteria bacterium]
MSALTFLLVDDFAVARMQLRALIDNLPSCQVIGEAGDGYEAIQMVHRLHPNVILLDVSMPGINGIQVTKRIKREKPDTHIIIYSAYNIPLIKQRALKAGADAYFDKSELEHTVIAALVSQWLGIN